jgi:hypothetical protein
VHTAGAAHGLRHSGEGVTARGPTVGQISAALVERGGAGRTLNAARTPRVLVVGAARAEVTGRARDVGRREGSRQAIATDGAARGEVLTPRETGGGGGVPGPGPVAPGVVRTEAGLWQGRSTERAGRTLDRTSHIGKLASNAPMTGSHARNGGGKARGAHQTRSGFTLVRR